MEEAKKNVLVYYDKYQYDEAPPSPVSINMLPLVAATRTKKAPKEFFHIVRNVSPADQTSIESAFQSGDLNVAALPPSRRSGATMGGSVKPTHSSWHASTHIC